jgi:hypothetical protein
MQRSLYAALIVCGVLLAGPVLAQTSRAGDNTPEDQAVADRLRVQGSHCDAPACRNTPDGVYPESTGPAIGATSQSIAGGGQPNAK